MPFPVVGEWVLPIELWPCIPLPTFVPELVLLLAAPLPEVLGVTCGAGDCGAAESFRGHADLWVLLIVTGSGFWFEVGLPSDRQYVVEFFRG